AYASASQVLVCGSRFKSVQVVYKKEKDAGWGAVTNGSPRPAIVISITLRPLSLNSNYQKRIKL
ncbi:MAG: hypothetical protein M1609_15390, partial [Firmicutes bacterium]|nr:hypothetical protein [Bacillota bacterium]